MLNPNSQNNVLKDDFNWEIPFETVPLPSKGVVYDPNTSLFNKDSIRIKAMTAREEDILTSQALLKEGTVIENLIRSCVTDQTFDVNDLISGDRNALLVSIRITGYGSDYKMQHNCANCGHKNEVIAQLSELSIKRLKEDPVENGKNLFKFVLPVTKKTVEYKFMTGHDEKELEFTNKRKESLGIQKDGAITSFLENSIVSIDGITDQLKIKHFINNMPALDSRKLRLHIKENEPGIDMNWEYTCKNCKSDNTLNLPVTSEFFWPTT